MQKDHQSHGKKKKGEKRLNFYDYLSISIFNICFFLIF